jgi:arylsulfatase A-like enzyme
MNLLEESIIIITSDHGEEFGEHGGLSHDGKMYSELINIPLIICDPLQGKEQRRETAVSLIDIPPTVLYLFGFEPYSSFAGRSLIPLETYQDEGIYGDSFVKYGSDESSSLNGVYFYREKDLKIIYRDDNDSWEMFDLKEDPDEMNNIFNSSPLSKEMKNKLHSRKTKFGKL